MRQLLLLLILSSPGIQGKAQNEGGIGVVLEMFEHKKQQYIWYVNKVYKESPAEKAGIRAGDIVVTFNGTRSDEVLFLDDKLIDYPGSRMTLGIQRFSEKKTFSLTRQSIHKNAEVASETVMPAVNSIKEVNVSKFSSYPGKCLVGDCDNGKGIYKGDDNTIALATYKKGKINGLVQARGKDFYSEMNLVNGNIEGKSYTYYDNGDKKVTPYKNGEKDGPSITSQADGGEYETLYRAGEKISTRWIKQPVTKKEEKPDLEQEAQKLLKSLLKNGGKVIENRTITLGGSEGAVLFTPTADVEGYRIAIIHLTEAGKAKSWFNYRDTETIPLPASQIENVTVLMLKVKTYPGKLGVISFMSADEKYIPARLFVVSY